ncbi:MAG: GNAT family N-acetyltransferase [Lachnospiraceae bacterium]|nr:GNAT family N-acetyltransferase [Lachnospiraceae bacterium]
MLQEINNIEEKMRIARNILEALFNWFEIPETREQYISDSANMIMVAAYEDDKPIGFLCLKETGKETVELAVMGVLQEYHRKGVGKSLFKKAKEIAIEKGYSFMQVKTVKMGVYDDYDKTNLFYLSLGFKEFEVFPLLWDEANPCQVYFMSLK